jgi:ActR/RegA family two-component response regulator
VLKQLVLAWFPTNPSGLFASIFKQSFLPGKPRWFPIPGSIDELLARPNLEYLVLDLHSSPAELEILEAICRVRPSIQLIVIGSEGMDELVLESIVTGARAYLDLTADADTVREAIETVTSGSIWAPAAIQAHRPPAPYRSGRIFLERFHRSGFIRNPARMM